MSYIDTYKNGKVEGTAYDDEINVSAYTIVDKYGKEKIDTKKTFKGLKIYAKAGDDNITATKYKDTIYGSDGADTINSSLGNDTISGGKGNNRIIYSGIFDNDTISLTKTENLIIDLQSYGFEDITDVESSISGKNLVLTLKNYGKITLKNFAKSNVTGIDGSVKIQFDENNFVDLNEDNFLSYYAKDFSKKGKFTGSRFNETIDASGINKNTTISAKGGYNTIIGTDGYTDSITGGNDGNNIETGSGKKTITTGNGNDIITVNGAGVHKINAGNGLNNITVTDGDNTIKTGANNDTINVNGISNTKIYAGGGENNIFINNSGSFGAITIKEQKAGAVNNLVFSDSIDKNYYLYKNGKHLVIINENNFSTVTVENYFAKLKKQAEYTFTAGGSEMTFDNLVSTTKGFLKKGRGTIKGTDSNDYIIANDFTEKKISNDKIYSGKGDDIINAGKGENSIYLYRGDGQKEILFGGGSDTLVFAEDTELKFEYDNDTMIINYGNEDDNVVMNNYLSTRSVKYIQIGDKKTVLTEYCAVLSRGSASVRNEAITNDGIKIFLTNTFDGKDYTYVVKSLSGEQTADFEYLANGRLVIKGDNLEITAPDGQKDNIILLGNNDIISTGDKDDIIRVGYSMDSAGQYFVKEGGANSNQVLAGAGDDYVVYYGFNNSIDGGEGYDTTGIVLQSQSPETEQITNSELTRNLLGLTDSDNQVGWFNQGGAGGDCRLFVLLDSLNRSNENFDLRNYITVSQDENTYTVTFKNYTGTNKSTTVTMDDLKDFTNVTGDLDVVLIDYAMNKLCAENKLEDKELLEAYADYQIEVPALDTVQKAYYNTISNYIFGNEEITIINYNDTNFKPYLNELWNAYKNGEISNISVGIQTPTPDYKLGILTGHAYTLKELTETSITIVNPWDNADHLTLDLNKFYRLAPCVVVYGKDYYEQYLVQDNGFFAKSNDYISELYLDNINNDVAGWITTGYTTDITSNNDYINSGELLTFTGIDNSDIIIK